LQDFIGARLALDKQSTVVLYQIDLVTLFEAKFAHKIGRQPDRERIPPFCNLHLVLSGVDKHQIKYIQSHQKASFGSSKAFLASAPGAAQFLPVRRLPMCIRLSPRVGFRYPAISPKEWQPFVDSDFRPRFASRFG
jgi:hypothetical protein